MIPFPNPFQWFQDATNTALSDGVKGLFLALWRAALFLLQLAFRMIDVFTTPDVSGSGPLRTILPYTMFLGLALVLIFFIAQIGIAAWRRDGKQLGLALVGLGQFALVWAGFLAIAVFFIASMDQLTHSLLQAFLGIGNFSDYSLAKGLPRDTTDAGVAVLLGVLGLILLIPASLAYIVIMLFREAALMLLVATTPISAAGLVVDFGKTWFWKSLRTFFASCLLPPASAIVLGVGEDISKGVVQGAGSNTPQAIGEATVGILLLAIGAILPLVMFKLLAFVDPATPSGAAARNGLITAGGIRGLMGGWSRSGGGSGAAEQADNSGVSGGERSAESTTESRLSQQLGPVGQQSDRAREPAAQAGAGVGELPAAATGQGDDGGSAAGQAGNRDSRSPLSPHAPGSTGSADAQAPGLPTNTPHPGGHDSAQPSGLPQPPAPTGAGKPPGGGEIPPEAAVIA